MPSPQVNLQATEAVSNGTHPPISCITRTIQCFENQGHRNFRILKLTIFEDLVVKVEYSDPYASFEAMAKMELWNAESILMLNNSWEDGKFLDR